jgi:hypothetical protein
MLAYSGKRSAEAQRMMDFIESKEWGLMLLDEVQTAPAHEVCMRPFSYQYAHYC